MADSWEELALRLRKEVDEASALWVSRVWKAFGFGAVVGAIGMWAVLYFRWY
jgi:hypothetical protein